MAGVTYLSGTEATQLTVRSGERTTACGCPHGQILSGHSSLAVEVPRRGAFFIAVMLKCVTPGCRSASERSAPVAEETGAVGCEDALGVKLQPDERELPVPYRHHHSVLYRLCCDGDLRSAHLGLAKRPAVVPSHAHRGVGTIPPLDERPDTMLRVIEPVELHAIERPDLLVSHTDPQHRQSGGSPMEEVEYIGVLLHDTRARGEDHSVCPLEETRSAERLLGQHLDRRPALLAEDPGKIVDKGVTLVDEIELFHWSMG